MRTEDEIQARQQEFISAYKFKNQEYTPKMKAWESAINVSVKTRGYPVYSSDVRNREDAKFAWMDKLERLGWKYQECVQTKEQFIEDVFELQDYINGSSDCTCFYNNRIRIGQCQKSLSVYLKWMWCQNELASIPPVCPIDRQVLRECYRVLHGKRAGTRQELIDCGTAWSNLDDRELYKRLVDITEKVAGLQGEPLTAVWELFAFKEPDK